MKIAKKILWGLVILSVLSVTVYFIFIKNKNEKFHWKTQQIQNGDVAVIVSATGVINPVTVVQVGAQVTGTISKLFADYNSEVKEGEVIALIDSTLLSASLQNIHANVQRAVVQLIQMKKEFDRVKELFNGGAVPQSDYDIAIANYHAALSTLQSEKAQLRSAKINLQYAAITAPISGVVISRNVDVGQTIISSFNTTTLFTIANDLTKMQVFANVDEADIGQVKVGQKVSFSVDAYPDETFSGEVKQIRLQPTVIQNVVTYTVIIDVANPDLKLMPGLTANINIKIKEHTEVLKIPMNAFHFSPPEEYLKNMPAPPDSINRILEGKIKNKKIIWIKKEQELYPVIANIGLSDGSFTEATGNFKKGDEIVLGINDEETNATKQVKNPFVPSFRRK